MYVVSIRKQASINIVYIHILTSYSLVYGLDVNRLYDSDVVAQKLRKTLKYELCFPETSFD